MEEIAPRAACLRLPVFWVRLVGQVLQEPHDLPVEDVHPNDRLGARVAVVVPRHARRHDQVAWLHRASLAVDRRVGALATQHEPNRAWRMPMRRGHFTWQEVLQGHHQAVRGGALRDAGIAQPQHSALGAPVQAEMGAALSQQGFDLAPPPHMHLCRSRLGRDQRAGARPRGIEARRLQLSAVDVKLVDRLRRVHRHGHAPPGTEGAVYSSAPLPAMSRSLLPVLKHRLRRPAGLRSPEPSDSRWGRRLDGRQVREADQER